MISENIVKLTLIKSYFHFINRKNINQTGNKTWKNLCTISLYTVTGTCLHLRIYYICKYKYDIFFRFKGLLSMINFDTSLSLCGCKQLLTECIRLHSPTLSGKQFMFEIMQTYSGRVLDRKINVWEMIIQMEILTHAHEVGEERKMRKK